MNIRLFLEISKEFFELIHPPIVEETCENDKEKLDEEKGLEQITDQEECREEICGCNLCDITRKILLFINPTIYKKLNDNKVD